MLQPSQGDLTGKELGTMLVLSPSPTLVPLSQGELAAEETTSLGTELGGPEGKMKIPLTSPGQNQLRGKHKSQT